MFDSIKDFASSLDGKSLAIGAVLGAVLLGTVSVAYAVCTNKSDAEPEAPKADDQAAAEPAADDVKATDDSAAA